MTTDDAPTDVSHPAARVAPGVRRLQRPMRWGPLGVSEPAQAFALPVGTVTFLLSDIEGSTRLWEHEADEVMRAAVIRHYALLGEIVERHGGVRPLEQGEGDSIVAAFARPSEALTAALAAQLALQAEPWPTSQPLRVRMAVHTGEAQLRDDANYAGQAIIRTARLRALGHGGQVLVSGATRDLAVDQLGAGIELRPLGEHSLRDLGRPERVWQLVHSELADAFAPLGQGGGELHGVPAPLSPFIGRIDDVETLAGLVARERLVTATGSGGAGKTRLAQQVAVTMLDENPAGIWWVELAPITGDAVEDALRQVFGIAQGAAIATEESVSRILADRPGLLIVDNCEHVVADIADLVSRLMIRCPSLRVLATSRVMLDLPGELAWRVPPLRLPARAAVVTVEALSQFDAVRLFCDRARRSRPNFALSDENGPAVAELCHRLDGIPLAIELAAARARVLAPSQILDGLDDALRLLTGGSRAVLPRQQTLEASVAWSYELLAAPEQLLLRRLAVFRDGWTLDAAEGICADAALHRFSILDALDRLVDHSLVQVDDRAGRSRFRMLETVRHYAMALLNTNADDADALPERHAHWFSAWCSTHHDRIRTAELFDLLADLQSDEANAEQAFRWHVAAGTHDEALAILEVVCYSTRALQRPLRLVQLADELLASAHALTDAQRAWATWYRTDGLFLGGRPADAIAAATETLALASRSGQRRARGWAQVRKSTILSILGTPAADELRQLADESAVAGDRELELTARAVAAMTEAMAGRIGPARSLLAAIGDEPRDIGPYPAANLASVRGIIAEQDGRANDALASLVGVIQAPHQATGLRILCAFSAAQAAADCGADIRDVLDQDILPMAHRDGSVLAVRVHQQCSSVAALADDRVDDAVALLEQSVRSSDGFAPVALTVHELVYALAAAGEQRSALPAATGLVLVDAATRRIAAEESLRGGDLGAALREVHAALAAEREADSLRSILLTLECLGRILVVADRRTEAARIFGACDEFRRGTGMRRVPCLDRLMTAARARLATPAAETATELGLGEGAALDLRDAADYAARLRHPHTTVVSGWESLTPTERKVAELVAEGRTNPEVGRALLMSPATVKTHLSRVFTKVGVANRQQLVLAAARRA